MATKQATRQRAAARRLALVPTAQDHDGDTITLRAESAEMARTQILLIMHHRQIIAGLEAELVAKVKEDYGADLAQGGGWSLNVADGLLQRTPTAATPTPA